MAPELGQIAFVWQLRYVVEDVSGPSEDGEAALVYLDPVRTTMRKNSRLPCFGSTNSVLTVP